MALAPRALRQDTRCQFFKLCGSGTGEGFTPRPNWQVWSILASWPDAETAQAAILDNPVYTKWAARAREQFSLRMQRATGQAVKPHDFGRVRKDIARLKTVLAEKATAAKTSGK